MTPFLFLSKALGELFSNVTVTGNEEEAWYWLGIIPVRTSPKTYANGKLVTTEKGKPVTTGKPTCKQ